MQDTSEIYTAIPTSSVIQLSREDVDYYIKEMNCLPDAIFRVMNSPNTGAFLHGLAGKAGNNEPQQAAILGFTVLQVSIGEVPLAQLAGAISTNLKLPNDKAQKLANEIEKEIFLPISGELQEYVAKQRQSKTSIRDKLDQGQPSSQTDRPQNLIDLKKDPKEPITPW